MAGMNGTAYLVQVNTGTVATPVWVTVAAQRDATVDESLGTIDLSTKDSNNEEIGPGRYSATLSFDHLYIGTGQVEQELLRTAIRNRSLVQVREFLNGVAIYKASGYITSRSTSWPNQGEVVVSVEFHVSGGWLAGP